MSDENYTDNPLDDEAAILDMQFSMGGLMKEKSVEAIEAESNFNIPAGTYHAYIHRIGVQKNKDTHGDEHFITAFVNGEETSYVSTKIEVDFALLTNEEGVAPTTIIKGDGKPQTIRAFFVMPPRNPSEMDAYENGLSNLDKPKGAGFFCKQLKQMVIHLGFNDGQGGITDEANNPRNWKAWPDGLPRFLMLTVELGKKSTNTETGKVMQYSQVKMFSYADSDLVTNPPEEFAPTPPPKAQPAPQPQAQPAQPRANTTQTAPQPRPQATQRPTATAGAAPKRKFEV